LRQGTIGIDYVTRFESGLPGPDVVINALCHGNEICGAIAVERLIRSGLRPQRGRLTLVLANVAAYQRFDPARPLASRYVEEDFNRLWSEAVLDGDGSSVELRRARELRPIYGQADALLDLHSMTHPCEALTLCGGTDRARALALALGFPRWVVGDPGHAAGRRLIDYGPFGVPDREAAAGAPVALLVECGQHGQAAAAEVAFAMCLKFLNHFGLTTTPVVSGLMPALAAGPQRVVDVTDVVTASGDNFVFAADYAGLDVVPRAGTIIGYDQGQPVRTPHDDCILIMPARRVRRGQTAVRLGRIVAA
jgi:predicted deacylase